MPGPDDAQLLVDQRDPTTSPVAARPRRAPGAGGAEGGGRLHRTDRASGTRRADGDDRAGRTGGADRFHGGRVCLWWHWTRSARPPARSHGVDGGASLPTGRETRGARGEVGRGRPAVAMPP